MSMIVLANGLGQVGVPAAAEALGRGRSALDAVEAGIRPVEADSSVRFVGRGGDPNLLGEMECDAALMNGADLRFGAVGALKGYLHAVSVARAVMERLPHVLLVGEGAARFAAETGAEAADMLTDEARARHASWIARHVSEERRGAWPHVPLAPLAWPSATPEQARGTTVFLARDRTGALAAGTSTSGWSFKYPGRVGDSPLAGAGLYAHDRHGACACTHSGETAIRAGTAGAVIRYMKRGASVTEACLEAVEDLRDVTGGHVGPVVIHAIDAQGEPCVIATTPPEETPDYWTWREGRAEPERRRPEVAGA